MKERVRYVRELVQDAELELEALRTSCVLPRAFRRMWRHLAYRGHARGKRHAAAVARKLAGETNYVKVHDALERRIRRWLYESARVPRKDWEHV